MYSSYSWIINYDMKSIIKIIISVILFLIFPLVCVGGPVLYFLNFKDIAILICLYGTTILFGVVCLYLAIKLFESGINEVTNKK